MSQPKDPILTFEDIDDINETLSRQQVDIIINPDEHD